MGDNKVFAIGIIGFFALMIVMAITGKDSVFDNEATKRFKEAEKTKQIQYQWKIDSLKAVQGKK